MTETPDPPEEGGSESYEEELKQGYEGGPEAASGDEDMTVEGQMELHLRGAAPKSGPTAGGTVLAVDGTGLSRVTAVQVGDVDAEFMIVGGGDALNVITPGGDEGSVVDITVSADEESTDLGQAFTYTDADEDGS